MKNIDYDREKITGKLSLLMDNLQLLQFLKSFAAEDFIRDFRNIESAKHLLQVSIEAMIDIANHIVSRGRLGRPKSYAESFELLHRRGILDSEQIETYKTMVKFRNRVVHLYQKVEPEQVYDILQSRLKDFAAFAENIRRFLNDTYPQHPD